MNDNKSTLKLKHNLKYFYQMEKLEISKKGIKIGLLQK